MTDEQLLTLADEHRHDEDYLLNLVGKARTQETQTELRRMYRAAYRHNEYKSMLD